MPADSKLQLHEQDLNLVVESVFATMMGIEVRPTTQPCPLTANLVTAGVYLTGEWNGAAFIHCLPQQACGLAARFLELPPVANVDDDVRDVMGELTNMVAGNLKCTLCPGIRVSVPSVVDGCGYSLRVCGTHLVCQSGFETPDGAVWVTLVEGPETA